jgi:hypothetical protein
MSILASVAVYSRSDDWGVALTALLLFFIVVYPFKITYDRYIRMRRIKKQLVTSAYKLPIKLTPPELSYVFSTKVSRQQMYATLRDLANRSVIIMEKKANKTTVSMGPKVDSTLKSFEKMLVAYIHASKKSVSIEDVLDGFTNYKLKNGEIIRGSRSYVFWWLLRNDLREHGLIEKKMTGKYTKMIINFGVIISLVISIISIMTLRILQMTSNGEIDISAIVDHLWNGILFWLATLIPTIVFSFFLLRFKGRMAGREWLMTKKFDHYLGQLEAYREFVRLTHKNKLRFESKALEKESKAETLPYAIALGYAKE